MKTEYTLGLLFNGDNTHVALIRKLRPAWQANRLNGIGGHLEEGEVPLQCMQREFNEEAELHEHYLLDWQYFALIDSPYYSVHCFAAHGDLRNIKSKTDEKIEVIEVATMTPNRNVDCIENLPWLVGMAIDFLNDRRPSFATIKYS